MSAETVSGVNLTADAILGQCAGLIESLTDEQYARPCAVMANGTIGQHVRHALDHYRAILSAGVQPIDYDHRERDVPVETDRAAAITQIGEIRDGVALIGDDELNEPVRIRVMLSGAGEIAELGSTRARELFFASHHAIHHQAMIKAIACEFGTEPCEGFGIAPSTINYNASRSS